MLFKFKYPKLVLLIVSIILAYVIFTNPFTQNLVSGLDELNYLGDFIAGMLFPLGFTTAFSVGYFVTLTPENLILTAFIGALGSAVSNILIFSFVKFSFKKEFFLLEKRIQRVKIIMRAEKEFKKDISRKIRHYLMYVFIGIIIASPVPDEIADSFLAGFTHIRSWVLGILSFVLGFAGIGFLLWI